MPNNRSSAAKAKNSDKGNPPGQKRGQESGRGEHHGNAGEHLKQGHGNAGEHQKQNQGFKQAGRNDDSFDNVKNIAGGKNLKDGCLPKLFMLFLPFVAVGTFFFFKSIAS